MYQKIKIQDSWTHQDFNLDQVKVKVLNFKNATISECQISGVHEVQVANFTGV